MVAEKTKHKTTNTNGIHTESVPLLYPCLPMCLYSAGGRDLFVIHPHDWTYQQRLGSGKLFLEAKLHL